MTPDLTVIKAGTGVLTKSADGTLDRAMLRLKDWTDYDYDLVVMLPDNTLIRP